MAYLLTALVALAFVFGMAHLVTLSLIFCALALGVSVVWAILDTDFIE